MTAGTTSHRAASVRLDGDQGQLVVEWQDGQSSRFALAELRRACPCARCVQARQQASASGRLNLLQGEAAAATAAARSVERVGRYGIRITWVDGHDFGIYTLQSLRERATPAPSGNIDPSRPGGPGQP